MPLNVWLTERVAERVSDPPASSSGWGAAALTTVSGLQAFLTGVAVPAGMALFTAIKVLAARKVGDADSAAIGSDVAKHVA